MDEPRVVRVPCAALVHILPMLRSYLDRMADGSNGRMTADDMARLIVEDRMQAWAVMRGSEIMSLTTTEIVQYPRLRSIRFVACVGRSWREWGRLIADIEEWGRSRGCTRSEAFALPKWRHILTPAGYEVGHMIFEKVL